MKQPGVEFLHQRGDQADLGAALMQQRNRAVDVLRRLRECGDIIRLENLDADQVRVIREKTEQIQRLQNANNALAIDDAVDIQLGDHYPVHPLPDHDGERIAKLVGWPDRDERKIGELPHRKLV